MKRIIKNKKLFLILIFLGIFAVAPTVFALINQWPQSPAGTNLYEGMSLPEMVKYFYEWAITLGGLAAFIALVIAGFQYLTSIGDPIKLRAAKDRIISAVVGLVLLLCTLLILNTINPELTTLKTPTAGPPGSELAQIIAGTPNIGAGYGGRTSKYRDDSCEAWGPYEPRCDEFCYDVCKMYSGSGFGLVVGANPGGGKDEVWCACYNNPPGVELAKKAFDVGKSCECKGTATPQCGDYCFQKCQEQEYSWGTVTGCAPIGGTDKTWCTCWDSPGIKFTDVKTVDVGERCECRGDASPQCGDFCPYHCTNKEVYSYDKEENPIYYDFGYIPGPEACYAGGGTDYAWCTCVKYEKTECNNGVDDDGDGCFDLMDPQCSSVDDDSESPKAQCNNGIDDDGDGYIDLDDPECPSPCDNNESRWERIF